MLRPRTTSVVAASVASRCTGRAVRNRSKKLSALSAICQFRRGRGSSSRSGPRHQVPGPPPLISAAPRPARAGAARRREMVDVAHERDRLVAEPRFERPPHMGNGGSKRPASRSLTRAARQRVRSPDAPRRRAGLDSGTGADGSGLRTRPADGGTASAAAGGPSDAPSCGTRRGRAVRAGSRRGRHREEGPAGDVVPLGAAWSAAVGRGRGWRRQAWHLVGRLLPRRFEVSMPRGFVDRNAAEENRARRFKWRADRTMRAPGVTGPCAGQA